MKKNAIGIRCHEIGDKEKKIYALCKEYFGGENTFFVMNVQSDNVKVPEGFNSVIFNEKTILDTENLYWPKDVAWRCGDYCYYALWHALSGYEFIWLIENDVKICTDDAKDFFLTLKLWKTILQLLFLEKHMSVYLFIEQLRY